MQSAAEARLETPSFQLILAAFFAQVAATPRRALLLDYDGTLAPFQIDRAAAFPYPGVREALTALQAAGQTKIIIISGRTIADLERLLGLDPLPDLWGTHGWERRLSDGSYQPPELSAYTRAGLRAAHEVLSVCGLGPRLEPKPAGLALHWRGMDAPAIQEIRTTIDLLWTPIIRRYQLRLHAFDGGLELRAQGRDKGSVIRTVLAELGPAAAMAYLGDDMTDEDAFEALGQHGLRVLVRPERRPSAADIWLRPPDELLAFLHTWVQIDRAGVATPHGDLHV
jgi:trehalose 6-phosphate phosphatase